MRFKILLLYLTINFWGIAQDRIGIETQKRYYTSQSIIGISTTNDTLFVTKYTEPNTNKVIISNIILGSPFYKDKGFFNGTVFLDGGEANVNITYNLLDKNILLGPNEAEVSSIVIPDSFIVDNTKFVKLYPKIKTANHKDYFELIFDKNDIKLYKIVNVSLQLLKKPLETIYENNTYFVNKAYIKSNSYFFAEKNTFKVVKQSSKLFKLLGKKEKEIVKLAEELKLNPKREQDLLKIFEFFAKGK